MTAEGWHEQVGSVADEAARLLESLRRQGQEEREAPDDADARPGAAPGGFSCEDPVCQWCPVCRTSAFVRQLSPETLSGLAELAGFAASVLGDLASTRARQEQPRGADDD